MSGKYGATRFRFVTVNTSLVERIGAGGQLVPVSILSLNLFDDMVVLATLDSLQGNAMEGWVWVGHVVSPSAGTVILAFNKNTVSCTVVLGERRFQIRNDGGPIHVIRELTANVEEQRLAWLASAPSMSSIEMDVLSRVNQERRIPGAVRICSKQYPSQRRPDPFTRHG